MTEKIICAGFGGQGILSLGMLISYAGMIENREVSWCPSYGAEMRGGTANCSVIVSDSLIGSPVVSNDANTVIAMSLPSLTKFESSVKPGGKLFINSSLISEKSTRTDIEVYYIPANELALELGNLKIANMVMLGAVLKKDPLLKVESIVEAFPKVFGESKAKLIPINQEAIKKGQNFLN
ncbi:MAG: 2-oxoacid:acceptor oxidoreductase family protein [Fusobacteriaceae bacterium]